MRTLAQIDAVSMSFGITNAVESVDLTVAEGEVVGLLGANGAGKTTLIRLLLGLLRPSSGSVSLFGSTPSIMTRRRVGYVPQTLGLYDDLTVEENWDFTSSAFGISHDLMPSGITAWRGELVGVLPLGTQRRVAFAMALSHQPDLLVLDEPTSGVGPLSGARLWQEIREAAEHGVGVLVTTHNMDEAEQCDRLVIMADGHVVASGTATEIIGDHHVIEVRSDNWRDAYVALDSNGLVVQTRNALLRVAATETRVTDLLSSHGIHATTASVRANLEETFISLVTRPMSS